MICDEVLSIMSAVGEDHDFTNTINFDPLKRYPRWWIDRGGLLRKLWFAN